MTDDTPASDSRHYEYSGEQLLALLRRSYMAVDGLWFVTVEDRQDFAEALAADEAVWRVMPKIQARQARAVVPQTGDPLQDVARCLGLKFACEGHDFQVEHTGDAVELRITHCTWHDVFEKSQRLHIAPDIARNICVNEAAGWATEFGVESEFDLGSSICGGGCCCRFVFRPRQTIQPPQG